MSQASSDLQYITLGRKGYSRLVRINKNTSGPPLSESKSLGGALQHVDRRCNSGLLLQQDLVVLWGEPKGLQGRPMSRASKAGWGCSSKTYKAYGLKGFLLLALQAPSAPWTLAFFPPYFRLALVHQAHACCPAKGQTTATRICAKKPEGLKATSPPCLAVGPCCNDFCSCARKSQAPA